MAPKVRSCCIRFCCCCFSPSSSSDEKRQDPTSASPDRSSPSAIETPSVDSKRTEARKCEIEPVEPNPCNVSGPARQSDKAPASASPKILQKSDQDENVNVNKNVSGDPAYNETPPTASIEDSKYDMHAKASTSVPSNAVPAPSQSDKAPASASPNILQKSDQDENVNVNKNVSGDPVYNETPPTASIEESKYDMHAKASTSVPSDAVPAPSQSDKAPASASPNILQKSDQDESVNVNKNVSGYNETDPPTVSSEASKYDMPAKALTSVPSNVVPAPSQSFNVPQKSEGANVNINQNVSGDPGCSGSTPSSSPPPSQLTKSDLLKTIVDEVEGKGVDVNMDELMDHISKLLKLREQEMQLRDKKASTTSKFSWPEGFKKLNAILSWGTDLKNLTGLLSSGLDFASKLKEIKTLLEGIGRASFATAGLLVVAYALERFDELSTNKEKCWDLIKEMSYVGSVVQRLRKSSGGTREDLIEKATALVVEGAIICCTQIGHSAWKSFFRASKDKDDLSDMRQKLSVMYNQINIEIGLRVLPGIERILSAIAPRNSPLSKEHPEHAVGIEESIEEVINLLECESKKEVVTVILHGFGGIGKTTLADAVFSQVKGGKCSKVQLFGDIGSKPDIIQLQRKILKHLMEPGEVIPDIEKAEDGQQALGKILEKVEAFIYIDNVLDRVQLESLLPQGLDKAKKVRFLLTARNKDVKLAFPSCTPTKIYPMEGIRNPEAALSILKKDISEGLDGSQFDEIIKICHGIPLMLKLVARFIGHADDKGTAYSEVMQEEEKWKNEGFNEMRIRFAYEALPEICKDPFLDICSYFKRWDWDTVENIVGKSELKMLESRALVTKDTLTGVVNVHDVILELGFHVSKGKEVRLSFTSARELKAYLEEEKEGAAEGIKGIWLTDNKDMLQISALTLDLMHNSLRVLQLGKLTEVEGKCSKIFEKLVFFEAKVRQLPFLDVSKLKQLRYLSYAPNELKLSKMPSSLRHMEFDASPSDSQAFQISSKDLQQHQHLRILRLLDFSKLENLPEELGDRVKGLQELSLTNCKSIKKLPDSISKLPFLRILKMDNCSNLTELPVDFGSLSSLQELNLSGCQQLNALPDSVDKLSSLKLLNLSRCFQLLNLPQGLGKLTCLVELHLEFCFNLQSIPDSIGELKLLRALNLGYCRNLKELPDGFCNLSFITHLSFTACFSLEKLPDGFGQLKSLKVLDMIYCQTLHKLPEGFGQLKNLERLHLAQCSKLRELCNDFHCLSSLQQLDLTWCTTLEKLPENFHFLTSLQKLDLSWCPKLEGKSMDHVAKMNTLQVVDIRGSNELVKRWAEIQSDCHGSSYPYVIISEEKPTLSENVKENMKSNLKDVDANLKVSGATHCDEAPSSGSPNVPVDAKLNVSGAPSCNEAPSSSSSSSRVETTSSSSRGASKSAVINTILHKDIEEVDGKKVDVKIDELMKHISELLKLREEEMRLHKTLSNPSSFPWPSVSSLKNLKELLSSGLEVASALKDITSGTITTVLKDIGQASVATAGLLVVAYTLERFHDVSTNKEKCWDLIKEMSYVGSVVQRLKDSPKGTQEDVIEQATALVVEGAIICCTQIGRSACKSFFTASKDKDDLSDMRQKLNVKYMQINIEIGFRVLTAIEGKGRSPLSKRYPTHAVGIDEPVKEVLRLLEIESDKNAVTVILHGFGGMGKTTLADAVFSHVGGCKYSKVRLFKDINSTPVIEELQKEILEDLMEPGENIPEIRTHEDGQRELELVLKRVQAFIYIDNVLEGAELRKLLPSNMSAAKKVRILLTARDQNVNMACPLPCTKPEIYKLKGIKDEEAMIILQKEIKEGISDIQFKDIIQTCGGIPLMLTLTAPFIGRAPNKQEAYNTVMLQKEKWTGEHFKEMRYAFAYDALPRDCREPFLDICSYFKGWDWQTVQDIVGKDKLEMLESRALVTRTTNDVASVHDVILTLAQQKSKEESKGKEVRLTFNSARELEQLLQEEGAAEGIKGIWLSNNNDVLNIPATTLNLMHESLRVLQLGKLVMVEGKWSETFKELVFFEAKVEQLPFQDVSKLKQLRYLSYEPINEPNDLKLSKMPSSLRHMEIDGKSHRHAFQISSNALQQLEHLRILRLVNFSKLKNLPEKLGHQVKRLHELSLSKCRSITKLPDSISNLQSLQILKMDGCRELTKLPDDFGSLSSLRELHLHECSDLEALPESAEKLSSLTLLNLSCCVRLSNFPPCVGNLTRLVELNLEGCRDLKSIPEGIGELKLLRALYVSFCETLTELPDGLCNLSFITHLKFSWCLRLKKLPDRFGQLASLKVLELRWCKSLQKLPEGFGQLKNLEVLDLQKCDELEELCNDFHCLSSLQNLNLSGCYSLEGKSMDHMVKMNRLQLIVHIEGSIELEKRWAELIERDGDAGSRSLTVISGQDFSISRVNEKENIEKNLLSELDGLLTNGRREKFHLSELPANTLILVMWQFPSFIEEMIDDELQTKIIYIGPDFDEFSTEVKNNIFVVDVPTTRAKEMLEKVHLTLDLALDDSKSSLYLQIDRRMVGDGQRDEYRPCWRLLTNREMEEFVVCNCNRYLRLKQLADEEDEESNIGLLRALFAPQGDETTPVFQKNESSQQHPTPNSEPKAKSCGVDKLEGKTILLEMRPPDSFDHDIRLPSLKDMYLREKDRLNFEIISIPLVKPRQERDEYRIPYTVFELFEDFKREVSDVFDVYKQFSREVPWLVLQNPWMTITRAVQYFLAKHCTTGWEEIQKCEKWYPTINWIIDPKGRITIYSPSITPRDRGEVFEVLFKYLESESYQVRWGVNASLTTLGEIEEVRKKEWQQLKNMSTLEFLFNHLKSVQVKLKDLMFQGKFICLCRGSSVEEIACSMEQFRDSIHFIHVSHQVRVLWLASIISKKYYYPLENTTEMEGTSLLKLSRHESVSFIMRLHHLEEEINGMDESDKHLWELKSLLHSLLFDGSIALFDKGGNSVAAITGRDVESIFLSDRKDRAERLIKTMMKDSQIIKKMQTASAAAVEQQSVDDVYFDALRDYISELWGVQLYQLLKFKKEEKKRSPPRVTWPTSRGFCRLKNLLSEGANDDWVKDVISRHSEEDACHTIIKSVLKEIEEAEWAVAGLLAVAELLERMVTVPNDHRIKWLFVVDEMFRLAQYCKQFNEKDELWRRMKCGAIAVILIYSIGCCCLIDPSKFEFSYRRKVDSIWLRNVERELRKECDKLDQTRIEYLDNESGSLAKLMCYRRGFELWPESEDEGGPSSVHERSASFPKAGSTGLTGEEESEDELGPESENEGEDELGPESEDDGENESEDELGPESEDEDGPSSVHESSASFPKAGSTGSTGEEE